MQAQCSAVTAATDGGLVFQWAQANGTGVDATPRGCHAHTDDAAGTLDPFAFAAPRSLACDAGGAVIAVDGAGTMHTWSPCSASPGQQHKRLGGDVVGEGSNHPHHRHRHRHQQPRSQSQRAPQRVTDQLTNDAHHMVYKGVVQVPSSLANDPVSFVTCGSAHVVGISRAGRAFAWGVNDEASYGRLWVLHGSRLTLLARLGVVCVVSLGGRVNVEWGIATTSRRRRW